MRVVRERVEQVAHVLVQQGVATNLLGELLEFARGGQLAVDEQPRDLEVGRIRRDILDRVAAVAKDARRRRRCR